MPEKKVQPQSLDKGNQSRHLDYLFHFALIFNLTSDQIILKEGNAGILRIARFPTHQHMHTFFVTQDTKWQI